jgi:hypothetical protein
MSWDSLTAILVFHAFRTTYTLCGLMVLSSDPRTALGTTSELHGHAALPNRKLLHICQHDTRTTLITKR